jgi:hypothetical protein
MANYTVQIKPNKTAVTSVQIAKTPSIYLSQIADVDAGDPDSGEVLVYDSVTQRYTIKAIPVIRGGTF